MPFVATSVAVLAGVVLAGLAWRKASTRRRIPCPSWLAWVLDNPYTGAIAGSQLLVDRAAIEPGMRVLDVGAGSGRVTIPAALRVGPDGEVVAVDVQEAMLERVRSRAARHGVRNVRTITGAIENAATESDLAPASFERALLVTVLGEIPDATAALKAIHTALRPGGVLSITEFLPDPHFRSRSSVRRLAQAAGFEIDREFGWPVAFTMNFRKPQEAPVPRRHG